MKKIYWWYIGGLAVLIVLILSFVSLEAKPREIASDANANGATDTPAEIVPYTPPQNDIAPAGSHTYSNQKYAFSLQYPDDMQVTERSEAAGGRTITFEDAAGEKGFQIFITPYADKQISKSRIDLDTHKGIEGKPVEIVLSGGLHALAFFSNDAIFGRLREVWFLRNGNLYEVTTYAELDSWIARITNTLQFD